MDKLATLVVNRADQRGCTDFSTKRVTARLVPIACTVGHEAEVTRETLYSPFSKVCPGNEKRIHTCCILFLCFIGIPPFQIDPKYTVVDRVSSNSLPYSLLFPISLSVNMMGRTRIATPKTSVAF